MTQVWLYSLVSVIIVSLIAFVGIITLALSGNILKKILGFLVSFAAGGLFGSAFIHLLPEAVRENGFSVTISLSVLSGIILFFVLEKIIHWHHCHHLGCENHMNPVGFMALIGDGLHNFIDGLVIGAAYLADIRLGIATTIAVILHEIPQEIGDFAILIHAGLSKGTALLLNFVFALTAIFGTVAVLIIGENENMLKILLPLTAGGFIYIAGSDLIPELKHETKTLNTIIQLAAFVIGIFAMLLLKN